MAKKVQLKDNNGNKAYPVTSSACVGMSDGSGSLDKKIAGINSKSGYVTCTTRAGTAAKTASLSDFALSTGIRLVVKMSYANTATSPTLNVNNTGAKTLYYNGNPATADNTWEDGETLDVYYDGTNYQASNVLGGSGSGGNMILEWDTDAATTRLQVKANKRKAGMIISYNDPNNGWINEQYIGIELNDEEWTDNSNWLKFDTSEQTTVITLKSFKDSKYLNTDGTLGASDYGNREYYLDYYPVKKGVPIVFYTTSQDNRAVLAFYTDRTEESFVESVPSYNYGALRYNFSFIKAEYIPKQNGYIRAYAVRMLDYINNFVKLYIGNKSILEAEIAAYTDGFTELEEEGLDGLYSFSMIQNGYFDIEGTGNASTKRIIRVGKGFHVTIYTNEYSHLKAFAFLSEKDGLKYTYSVNGLNDGIVNEINYTIPEDGFILIGYNRGEGEMVNHGEYKGKKLPYLHITKTSEESAGNDDDGTNIELSKINGVQDHSLPNLFNKNVIKTYDSDFADKVFEKIGRKTDSTGCYSNEIECKEGDWFTRSDFGTGIVVVLDDSKNILGDVANAAYQPTIQITPSDPERYDFSNARYVVFVVMLSSIDTEKIVKAPYMPYDEGDFLTIPKLRLEPQNVPQDLDFYIKGKSGRYYSLVVDDSEETPILSIVPQDGIPMSELPDDFPTFKTTGDFSEYYDSLILCPIEGNITNYLYELTPTGLVKRYIKQRLNCPRVLKEGGVWYYYGVSGQPNVSSGKLNIYKAKGETFELVKGDIGNSKGQVIEPHDCLVISINPLHYICQRYEPGTTTIVDGESKIVNALHVEEVYEGNSVWEWHSEDYPELWYDSFNNGHNADYLHNNTIDLDKDGNLCLNNRSANQILVIERTWDDVQHIGTIGNILWKIGGNKTHTGWDVPTRIKTTDAEQWYGSHDAVVSDAGVWTMFDNVEFLSSRIIEFGVNTETKTLVNFKAYTFKGYGGRYMGSVDKYADGIYLVSWGSVRVGGAPNAGLYDFNNTKAIFEIRFDATGSSAYRVYGIKKGQS